MRQFLQIRKCVLIHNILHFLHIRKAFCVGIVVAVVNVGLTFGNYGDVLATIPYLPSIVSGSSRCLSEKRALKRTIKLAKLAVLAMGTAAAKFAKQPIDEG